MTNALNLFTQISAANISFADISQAIGTAKNASLILDQLTTTFAADYAKKNAEFEYYKTVGLTVTIIIFVVLAMNLLMTAILSMKVLRKKTE